MSRVNLLTIHWGCSYGAMLQTYATVKLLEEQGHEVSVINLRHPGTQFNQVYKTKSSFLNLWREIQFEWFRKRNFPNLTRKMFTIQKELLPAADYYVVGSDQVWNSKITGPFKSSFYLDFLDGSAERIALSSSFGTYEWKESADYTNLVQTELAKFSAISVREQNGVGLLRNKFNIEAIQLLDPTLAYGKFDNLIKPSFRKKQIFPFLLKNDLEQKRICQALSRYLDIPLYSLNRWKTIFDRSISSWLSHIKYSDFIVTDSFHGLAFCILFHKNFIVLCADVSKFARLESLLELLGLSNRVVVSYADFNKRIEELTTPIEYMSVEEILMKEREKMYAFINNNIR